MANLAGVVRGNQDWRGNTISPPVWRLYTALTRFPVLLLVLAGMLLGLSLGWSDAAQAQTTMTCAGTSGSVTITISAAGDC